MLLSLVAHVIGYKTIVGAHNTVDVRCMWEVASSSPYRANDGAYNTVGVQKHVGEPYRACHGMGVDGAHNTVGQMSVPTILLGF